MRIGVTSNTIFKTMPMALRANNNLSPLQKQKFQLQEQIKKIEESKSSKESKKSSIKELQEKLEELGEQIAKEKLDKPTKEIEDIKSKDKKGEQENVTEESEENSQVINKDVMIGITSASAHQKIAKIAYLVYREATARGNMATAKRSLNYTTSEIKQSAESRKLIERGLKEYKKQMENLKRTNTQKGTSDNVVRENDVSSEGERTITNEVHDLNTSKVATRGNSEIKSSVEERR